MAQIVQCDDCGAIVEAEEFLGNPRRLARELGWMTSETDLDYPGHDYCPKCAPKHVDCHLDGDA